MSYPLYQRRSYLSPIGGSPLDTYENRMPTNSSRYSAGGTSYTPWGAGRSSSLTRTTPQRRYTTSNSPSSMADLRPISSSRRPLPNGPGPLDSRGNKLESYKVISKTTSSVLPRTGPLKADHTNGYNGPYATNTTTSYRTNRTSSQGFSTLQRPTSGLKGRRSNSMASLNDNISEISLKDDDFRTPRAFDEDSKSLRLKDFEDYKTPRTYNDDDLQSSTRSSKRDKYEMEKGSDWRTPSRSSRTSVMDRQDKDHINSYSELKRTSPSKDPGLPPLSKRRDPSVERSKSISRQNSSSSINVGSVSRYSNLGKVGIKNIGNTCFMNSVLQCLSNTKHLLEYCLKDDYELDKNGKSSMKGLLITAYANLMSSLWKESNQDSYISPSNFKTQIQRFAPRFMGYAQQDAQEFLRYLLEGLHEDVNRIVCKPKHVTIDDDKFSSDSEKAKEYWNVYLNYDNSKVVEIFVGQLKSELKFRECNHSSTTFDPFWDLSVPIPKNRSDVSIQDCINLFMKEEELDHDERPTCAKCKKRRACTKSFYIQRFPKILVLHLKRFSQERYSRKVSTYVDFPQNLDLSEYSAEKGPKIVYNLYAVSNHSGGTHSGHYTAYCKHPYNGHWYLFNDTRVSSASASQAVSSEAYVLFYELSTQSTSRL